ncbi:hypothetical protein [Streptomyces syringium]|uniref:hypothetical protein n=1 Tax=Streptomyces syringium TaxID=76729 RepID=UPI003AAA7735
MNAAYPPQSVIAAAVGPAAGFRPTHVVPGDGMPTWEAPDGLVASEPLDALLPVRLLERRGDWGQVLCLNGWSAWVDARLLLPVPQGPPSAGQQLARTADARALLARVEETVGRYHRAVEDLAAGRTDGETFRDTTRGLRIGAVIDGEAMWVYDAEHDRWCYCDGTAMATFAVPGTAAEDAEGAGGEPGAGAGEADGLGAPPTTVFGDR